MVTPLPLRMEAWVLCPHPTGSYAIEAGAHPKVGDEQIDLHITEPEKVEFLWNLEILRLP